MSRLVERKISTRAMTAVIASAEITAKNS